MKRLALALGLASSLCASTLAEKAGAIASTTTIYINVADVKANLQRGRVAAKAVKRTAVKVIKGHIKK